MAWPFCIQCTVRKLTLNPTLRCQNASCDGPLPGFWSWTFSDWIPDTTTTNIPPSWFDYILFLFIFLWQFSVVNCLTRLQLAIKGPGSYSWYVELKKVLIKYDLPCCWDLLDSPIKEEHWEKVVNKKVNRFWSTRIKQSVELYPSLIHWSTLHLMTTGLAKNTHLYSKSTGQGISPMSI